MSRGNLKKRKWDYKIAKKKSKKNRKYWWISLLYIIIPLALLLLFNNVFYPLLMKSIRFVDLGNGLKIENSNYAVNNVYAPFCQSMLDMTAVILTFFILNIINKWLIKHKYIFQNANRVLKYFECFILLFTIVIAVYSKVNGFDCTEYGFQVEMLEKSLTEEQNIAYIPLQEIPSIHSIGIRTSKESFIYIIISRLSQVAYSLSDNFELFIALAGAVILPFKKYVEQTSNILVELL